MKTKHEMTSLNAEGTQFGDLRGIICFNISNLLNDNGTDYLPYQERVIFAAQAATKTQLQGSDAVNLLTQARAILQHVSIISHLSEGGEFDIVDIVTRQYPKEVMCLPKHPGTNSDMIRCNVEFIKPTLRKINKIYVGEVVEMVQCFERELQGLHLSELMIHSDEFKLDSIVMGLGKMSVAEKILRKRINTYMEIELTKMIQRKFEWAPEVRHVETLSLPLEIGDRVAACHKFYNKFGEGAWQGTGILFAGDSSSGEVFYDELADDFDQCILKFYEEYVK